MYSQGEKQIPVWNSRREFRYRRFMLGHYVGRVPILRSDDLGCILRRCANVRRSRDS